MLGMTTYSVHVCVCACGLVLVVVKKESSNRIIVKYSYECDWPKTMGCRLCGRDVINYIARTSKHAILIVEWAWKMQKKNQLWFSLYPPTGGWVLSGKLVLWLFSSMHVYAWKNYWFGDAIRFNFNNMFWFTIYYTWLLCFTVNDSCDSAIACHTDK